MRVVVAGGDGLIGQPLVGALRPRAPDPVSYVADVLGPSAPR